MADAVCIESSHANTSSVLVLQNGRVPPKITTNPVNLLHGDNLKAIMWLNLISVIHFRPSMHGTHSVADADIRYMYVAAAEYRHQG